LTCWKSLPIVVFTLLLGQSLAVQELQVEWTFNTSDVFEGRTFGAGQLGCQTVWDIDGDGMNEVIFGTRRGDSNRMWCIDQEGSFEWLYPPLDQPGLIDDPMSKVSVVDVDSDGTFELCFADRSGRLHIINGDGTEFWHWDNPRGARILGPPQAYDVDGDGFIEFFLADGEGFVHRLSHEGELVWTSFQCGRGNPWQVTLADIDTDGEVEVLWASNDFHLYCASSGDGSEEWRFDAGANMETNSVFVADVNGDGGYEAVIWTSAPTSAVIVVSSDGNELGRWIEPHGANIRLTPAMGDVDEDGSMDMALMSGLAVYVIDLATMTTKWEANISGWVMDGLVPEGATANHWSNYPLIADIDGDSRQEVLWLAPYPIATDAATGDIEYYYLNEHVAVNRRQENGGWWGDVDRDGVSEWVVELNGNSHPETQMYCLTAGGSFPAESPWPEFCHCAYPAPYQQEQEWLTLKAAYSNSMWFPIPELGWLVFTLAHIMGLFRRLDHLAR